MNLETYRSYRDLPPVAGIVDFPAAGRPLVPLEPRHAVFDRKSDP